MFGRKDQQRPRFRPSLELLEDRNAAGNLLPYLTSRADFAAFPSFYDLYGSVPESNPAMASAPYSIVAASEEEQEEESTAFPSEETFLSGDKLTEMPSQGKTLEEIEASHFVAHTRDPFAQADGEDQHLVGQDENDALPSRSPRNSTPSAEHLPASQPNSNNKNPPNLAGAYTGAGQGPAGVSTPNPSGGGSNGGNGGSANLHLPSQTQLQQMNSNANSQTASATHSAGSGSGSGSYGHSDITPNGPHILLAPSGSGSGSGSGSSSGSGGGGGGLNWFDGSNAPNTPPGWTQDADGELTITAPPSQDNTEGDSVSLQVQGNIVFDDDDDSDTFNYAALDLPPGLSINATTGLISGTIAYGDSAQFDGTYSSSIIVYDDEGASAATGITWTINPASITPVVTNPGSQTNIRGDNVSLQINASQVDGDAISYYASNLPPGLSIDCSSGLISGTVSGSAMLGSPYPVTITSTDNVTNLTASQMFNWTIDSTNVAPVLSTPGNQINSAGDNVSLQVNATDADGDALTYTAAGLPAGLTIDPTSGIISGTLPNSAANSTPYNVTVSASDGLASSSQNFTWTVNVVSLQNPGDQINLDGDSVSLQLAADDANNASLTYSASGLPSGLSINSSTGLISGIIASTADTNSPYSVTVTATDSNNDSVSQSFNWTVSRVTLNSMNDQEDQEGTPVSLQLSAIDNESTPTYIATGLPPGLSISSTGLISGTIGIGSFGSSPYQVTVTAADGSNTSSQSFVWTVTPRVALVNPGLQSNAAGDSVSLQLSATSPGGTMSYSATGLPPGLSISSSGLISGSPATAASTPYTVTVTANDGTSSSSQTFAWTISTINLVSPGDQTNNDGDLVSLWLTAGYHGGGTLSYNAAGLPPGLSINSSNGRITGTISGTANTSSPYSATVTATDGMNTSSQTFNWTINAVVSLDPIDNQIDAVGDTVSMQVGASDGNDNTLTYSATGLPSGLNLNSTTGLISGTISVGADMNSPNAVTVTATDSAGNSASQNFTWTIGHVSLINPGSQQDLDGAKVSLQLQGGDADGDLVTYTATGCPPGISISSSGLISGTIASNADVNSPYAVTVTSSDGANNTAQTFLWTVSQVMLSAPGNQTNIEGDNLSLQLQGTASNGTLSYNASGLPSGLSLNATTGLISGSIAPGDAANGPYTVDVSASNGTISTSQTFTWTINPVVNLTVPADQSNIEGNGVSLQVLATDSKNAQLSYTASGLPSGLSINSSNGQITGTIAAGDPASSPYVVIVTASDGTYSSSTTFSWTVSHSDSTALSMTIPGTQVNVSDDSVNLQINASDPDGEDFLTYSATGLPGGLAINPYSGLIAGTVADDAVSATPYSVTVTASDGNGQSVSKMFTMIINAAPIMAVASPINAVEGNDTGSVTLAVFATPDLNAQAADFTVTINYGDGTTDYGSVSGSNGSFTVTGDHTYLEYGSYAVTIVITDSVTGASTIVSTTATVSDAPLTLVGSDQLGDIISDAQGSFIVATLTDANPYATAADFTVTINWGDGISDIGAYAVGEGGSFIIEAAHNYTLPMPNPGPFVYTVSITVQDDDGTSASTTSTVVAGSIEPNEPATMGTWVFTDSDENATAGSFTITVDWGDGTSDSGTAVLIGGGDGSGGDNDNDGSSDNDYDPLIFSIVTPPHTYTQDSYDQPNGQYQITMTVTSNNDGKLTGIQYVSVVRPPLEPYTDNVETPPNSLSLSNVALAAFTVPDALDVPSEFNDTIYWGDNSSSNGTIEEIAPGLFEILGSHTYASAGVYDVQVDISQHWSTGMIPVTICSLYAVAGTFPIIGPTVVPGKSIYTYFAPLVGTVGNNPWSITTDPAVGGGATPQILLWGKTILAYGGKVMPALFADVQFSNSVPIVATIRASEFLFNKIPITFTTNVDVVRVLVNASTAARNTVMQKALGKPNLTLNPFPYRVNNATYVLRHYYGDDVGAFTFSGELLQAEDIVKVGGIKIVNNQPQILGALISVNAPVDLIPPPSAPAGVITNIQVGLTQNAWGDGFAAYANIRSPLNFLVRQEYIGGFTGGIVTMLDWLAGANVPPGGANYHDYAPGAGLVNANTVWPWYDPQNGAWRPTNASDDSHTLSMADAPSAVFPRYYNGNQQIPLLLAIHTSSFQTFVAARTVQNKPQFLPMAMFGISPQGRSDYLYYAFTFFNWSVTYRLTGGARMALAGIVDSLSPWIRLQSPYMPAVNVVPASVGGNSPFTSWQ